MKRVLTIILAFVFHLSYAQEEANCYPPQAIASLDINNVRASIGPMGSFWHNKDFNVPSYEIPRGGGNHVIYAGGIWLGGKRANDEIVLAAIKFQKGNDFWAGPLSQTVGSGNYNPLVESGSQTIRDYGNTTIDKDVCLEYDRFFTIKRAEVLNFAMAFECQKDTTCEQEYEISNDALNRINNWPAHGDISKGQDYYLAPFYDYLDEETGMGDGVYDPAQGDYPWYDGILGRNDINCNQDRRIALKGDQTHWWVFNDKGNKHTESGGTPIGIEVRAQAYAYATNDDINDMTFYNYEFINRGNETVYETYFSMYVDADIGFAFDDYVGCDVSRGLGYCYNATNFDPGGNGASGYGENPPAVGLDFFEGPYQDADGLDNVGPHYEEQPDGSFELIVPTVQEAIDGNGIVYEELGSGYSDGVVDNERFGMRRFNYYINSYQTIPPPPPLKYYNFMIGKWKDDSDILFGGTGYTGTTGVTDQPADYMYPNDSDPLHWGTQGNDMGWDWTERNTDGDGSVNPPDEDKRIMIHSGPFTLEPGAVNSATVGVVYGRALYGDAYASVEILKRNDTKAQKLFDNCFRIIDPPHAPRVEVIESDQIIGVKLSNPYGNNINESYEEEDPNIIDPSDEGVTYDKTYKFEGYQVFQVRDKNVNVTDLKDSDKARLVGQCDIENDITTIVNYEFDNSLGFSVPIERVNGSNSGIVHTFYFTTDAFTSEILENYKKYYYIAIAYAHNEYKPYDPDNPDLLDGQKKPYFQSVVKYDGSFIEPVEAMPHFSILPNPDGEGSFEYSYQPVIECLDGTGNGGNNIALNYHTELLIVAGEEQEILTYRRGRAPIEVEVVDPEIVPESYYELHFISGTNVDTSHWEIRRFNRPDDEEPVEIVTSDFTIDVGHKKYIPEWGISVKVKQVKYECASAVENCPMRERVSAPIASTVEFFDANKNWLTGVNHKNIFNPQNWIMSGSYTIDSWACNPDFGLNDPCCYNDLVDADPNNLFTLLDGTLTLGQLARFNGCGLNPVAVPGYDIMTSGQYSFIARNQLPSVYQPSVDIVITPNKDRWTRCPVIELGTDEATNINGALPGLLRKSPSIDKSGRQSGDQGYNAGEGDMIATEGMGWFPGYAIDVETGRRLNMAYCENSSLANHNGSDMVWNPTTDVIDQNGNPVFGGQHAIYVFGGRFEEMPSYDRGEFAYEKLNQQDNAGFGAVYRNLSWVMRPLLAEGHTLNSTRARVSIRIEKKYNQYERTGINEGNPVYRWNFDPYYLSTDKEVTVKPSVTIYPNPATNFVTIDWKALSSSTLDVVVFSGSGRRVINKSLKGNSSKLNVNGLSPGVYYVRMRDEFNKIHTSKIVKQH